MCEQVLASDVFGTVVVTEQGGLCTFTLNDSSVAVTGASVPFLATGGAVSTRVPFGLPSVRRHCHRAHLFMCF